MLIDPNTSTTRSTSLFCYGTPNSADNAVAPSGVQFDPLERELVQVLSFMSNNTKLLHNLICLGDHLNLMFLTFC